MSPDDIHQLIQALIGWCNTLVPAAAGFLASHYSRPDPKA